MQIGKKIVKRMRSMHAMAHVVVLTGKIDVVRNDSNKMVSTQER